LQFKVYNLCSERDYEASTFEIGGDKEELGGGSLGGRCARYPFDDHNPAPIATIKACCDDMQAFLDEDDKNVIAIHCKAGKGRTGMIISAFLVHCGMAATATDALQMFGNARTHNGKGVTIPSQMRYVHYYQQCMQLGAIPPAKTYRIRHFRLHTIPNLDPLGGCDPYFDVRLAVLNDDADVSKGLQMRKVRAKPDHAAMPPLSLGVPVPVCPLAAHRPSSPPLPLPVSVSADLQLL
jgi:phosphatidylinositol-3,4,5-trisphosphate 3-phosphatase/dual-specificity protein phosphatase PTEN